MLAPAKEKTPGILTRLLPVVGGDVVRAVALQRGNGGGVGRRDHLSRCLTLRETRQRDTLDLLSRICISHEPVPRQSVSAPVSPTVSCKNQTRPRLKVGCLGHCLVRCLDFALLSRRLAP